MLLGVYWYYHFPKGLYRFDYFTFQPGRGGLADGPAELTATVQAPDPAALLAEVRAVAARYPDGYLFARQRAALVQLELGDYALTDYTFHVATELERVLRRQQATVATGSLPPDTPCCAWPSRTTPTRPTPTATACCKPSAPSPATTTPRWLCCASTATCRCRAGQLLWRR